MINFRLLLFLTFREISQRYKQSFFGLLWLFINPLCYALPFIIIYNFALKTDTGGYPYPIFIYSGFIFWNFFTSSINTGVFSITNYSNIINNASFSREIIPLSIVLSRAVDFFASLPILFIMFILYKINLSLYQIYLLPIFLAESILIIGMVYLISSLHVFIRDVGNMMPIVLFIWLFATPVIYSTKNIPINLLNLLKYNPMVGIIDSARGIILSNKINIDLIIPSIVVITGIFFLGRTIFKILEPKFPDVI